MACIMKAQTRDCGHSGVPGFFNKSKWSHSSLQASPHLPGPAQSLQSWEAAIWSRGPFLFSSLLKP